MKKGWTAGAFAVLVFGLVPATTAAEQAYPNRPVRFIVPFPPGGGVDISNRIVASRLTDFLKQERDREVDEGDQGGEYHGRLTTAEGRVSSVE
jgi:tripartite-type tricarboxylate transporter receptor subunit TctC